MSIGLAVTAYYEQDESRGKGSNILRCIRSAHNHPEIKQIAIVDDASLDYPTLKQSLGRYEKVVLSSNVKNLGVFGNKLEAIARCKTDWVITCDSDNVMSTSYIDAAVTLLVEKDVWYCPSFAKPKFDYRHLARSEPYTLDDCISIVTDRMFCCCFNTGNQIVNRSEFLAVFEPFRGERADLMMPNWLDVPLPKREDIYWRLVFDANDSFIYNLTWLQSGRRVRISPELQYEHHYSKTSESNYNRSPREKIKLSQILLRSLYQKFNLRLPSCLSHI